ncbi:hypothetical protein GCM10011360_07550 [Primorskyibacter flagellatus]|uniref:Uncharacterized protein n=1 Tax=Primorskyibacter flagellatus TaxID=1387277 RepID=A0A917EDE1_9RHOB|nr:hypothetical protein [Primorskyibacter flagellatus]GGE21411.1 hypothetical protein GCM10011360_07550 [Primorskyibacter flagellatus]
MAERHRSQDQRRETEEVLGDKPEDLDAPDQGGAKGGNLQRKVGSRDERKRLDETSAGATRPLGQDKNDSGDKEKV